MRLSCALIGTIGGQDAFVNKTGDIYARNQLDLKQPSDLWNLEHYLTECRKRIDRKFDYRYSVLIQVFGELLHRGRLSEGDLRGLSQDKLDAIRSYAAFLASPMLGTTE